MKALWRWLLVLMLGALLCVGVGEAKGTAEAAKRPRTTALVTQADPTWLSPITVIGGYAAGRGWVGSKEANGLMRKGDRLSVYTMREGRIGSARLTDNGYDLSRWNTVAPPSEWKGLGYSARLRFSKERRKTASDEAMLAVWHAAGSPEPRWIQAAVLNPKSPVYRTAVLEWLRERGMAKEPQQGVLHVHQLLRADLNSDQQHEVLLVFSWRGKPVLSGQPPTRLWTEEAGGVLMRYLPRGLARPRIVVLLDSPRLVYEVLGVCDLDGDGWGEVIVSHDGNECGGTCLCYWTGQEFDHVSGDLGGE